MSEEVKETTEEALREEYKELEKQDAEAEQQFDATVTTIAEEEKKTGQPVALDPEMLKQKAISDYLFGIQYIQKNAMKMGKRALIRSLVAILQMPEGKKMPSKLKTREEQLLFAMGQKSLAGRFTLVYDQIINNIQQNRMEEAAQQQAPTEEVETKTTNEEK